MLPWALAVVGLTTIITQSKLFAPIRRVFENRTGSKFLCCPMCMGFWVGLGLSLILGLSCGARVHPFGMLCLVDGWASSGLNWIVYVVLIRLGAKDL
jgi:hypothetical protein